MKSLADKVNDFIALHGLISRGDKTVAALSGGADSVALFHLLRLAGVDMIAAHCNFHLRGQESDRDEAFVRELCRQYDIPLKVISFDVGERRRATGESVEMACRSLRYEWFEQLRLSEGAASIAVAHHRDDNVETFFLNALRGSGVAGLKGILPRNGHIIRPLLGVSRDEIEHFLAENGFDHITDSTNAENLFRRNRIRNRLIPLLEELFPDAATRLADTIGCLRGNHLLLGDYIDSLRARYIDPQGIIDLRRLVGENPHPAEALSELCRQNGLTAAMARDIVADPMRAGLRFGQYILDRGMLKPLRDSGFEPFAVTPGVAPLTMKFLSPADFRPRREPLTAWFDARVLDGDPQFEVRPWRISDRFRPFGLHGSKKLSDLFAGFSLDAAEKNNVRLLTRDGEILWVVGLRQSALFSVSSSTAQVVEFKWIES